MKSKKIKKKRSRRIRGHPEPEWLEEEIGGFGEEYETDFLGVDDSDAYYPDFDESDEYQW